MYPRMPVGWLKLTKKSDSMTSSRLEKHWDPHTIHRRGITGYQCAGFENDDEYEVFGFRFCFFALAVTT